ncbi:MAG: hypothetical protein R3B97_06875 [Dehalococcoidia bacterium]|nr:hypothetical protein [Dehalococcoidia bacterium]MCB9485626.1 hypothetical protein [Thermoflexaceae bacterium]
MTPEARAFLDQLHTRLDALTDADPVVTSRNVGVVAAARDELIAARDAAEAALRKASTDLEAFANGIDRAASSLIAGAGLRTL